MSSWHVKGFPLLPLLLLLLCSSSALQSPPSLSPLPTVLLLPLTACVSLAVRLIDCFLLCVVTCLPTYLPACCHSSLGAIDTGNWRSVFAPALGPSMMGAMDNSASSPEPPTPTRLAMRAPQQDCTAQDFLFGPLLGLGSYSKVVKAKRKDSGEVYALKIMNKRHIIRENKVKFIKMERMILDQLDFPGVVKLHFTFQDVQSLYMGLECCADGELFDQIRRKNRMSEEETRFYTAEIIDILEYIHSQGIVHRDLKPENLLVSADGHLKLCDFGSAKMVRALPNGFFQTEGESSSAFVGTAEYVSPEVLHGNPVNQTVDLWALGCTVYQMLEGRPPFKAATEYLIFQKVMTRELSMPSHFSPEAKDLVERLLNLIPNERLGARGYDELRNHPFLMGFDWSRSRRSAPKLLKKSNAEGLDDTPEEKWQVGLVDALDAFGFD